MAQPLFARGVDSPAVNYDQVPVLQFSAAELYPFLWGRKSDAFLFSEELLQQPDSKRDPLKIAFAAYQLLYEGYQLGDQAKLVAARRYLEYLAVDYTPVLKDPHGWAWQYAFAHGSIPAGWWSAMSNALIGMSFQAGFQLFAEPRYAELAKLALNGMLRPPALGGSLAMLPDGNCWFSEYTWQDMRPQDEMFVLNGHLFALQALWMVGKTTGNSAWTTAAACGIRGVKSQIEAFHTIDKKWFWYSLSPLLASQTHYVIYETMQFSAMATLTGDSFFDREVALRRKRIAEGFPIFVAPRTDGTSGTLDFLFSQIGPPHLYLIDLYATRIICFDNKNSVTRMIFGAPGDQPEFFNRAFVRDSVPVQTTHCQVYTGRGNDLFLLYDAPLIPTTAFAGQSGPNTRTYKLTALYDAVADGPDSVMIDPETSPIQEGRLVFALDKPMKRSEGRYFGLLADFETSTPLGIGVVDARDREAFRYSIPPKGGAENLILFHWRGFDRIDAVGDEITHVRIYFYTDRPVEKFRVKNLRLVEFSSLLEIFTFWEKNKATLAVPEQRKKAESPALGYRESSHLHLDCATNSLRLDFNPVLKNACAM